MATKRSDQWYGGTDMTSSAATALDIFPLARTELTSSLAAAWTATDMTPKGTSGSGGTSALPVLGLDTYIFPAIHVTAITTCTVSAMVSAVILIYLFRSIDGSFWRASVGERLVVYLSICDLGFSISHGADHVVMIVLRDHTPQPACTVIAYIVQEFTLGQSLVVNIAAISAIIFIVRERKVSFGKYDWKLVLYAYGFPGVLGAVIAALGYMGPVGAWCFMDLTQAVGRALNTFYILSMILVFLVNSICYLIVFIKIQHVGSMMKHFKAAQSRECVKRTRRSAQNMALIVLAFLFQWSLYVAFTLWQFFGSPHIGLLIADVSVCNLGGVFNAVAYTLMRRAGTGKKDKEKDERKAKVKKDNASSSFASQSSMSPSTSVNTLPGDQVHM